MCLVLGGCSTTPASTAPTNPLAIARDAEESIPERIAALESAWARSAPGDRADLRAQYKDIIWDVQAPAPIRASAARIILADIPVGAMADCEAFTRLRLPTDPSMAVVDVLCRAATAYGWVSATPALIRSYARPLDELADGDRPEHAALAALHPDKPIAQVVLDVFLDPPPGDDGRRVRRAAWSLLGRLDPDGSLRADALANTAADDPLIALIRSCHDDLGVMPITGAELAWLARLADNSSWWKTCAAIVADLPPEARDGLRLRHLEALRLAHMLYPDLLTQSRAQLLAILTSRDDRRAHTQRIVRGEVGGPVPDRLRDYQDRLCWADLLTLIVVDNTLRTDRVITMLVAQANMDHDDRTTEYGGLLTTDARGVGAARLYVPRARRGDDQFIASTDMIEHGATALAHYHFHAQETSNTRLAGPSPGDLEYAAHHGCTCVVLTTLGRGVLGVDVYTPDGAIVDLGELRAPVTNGP